MKDIGAGVIITGCGSATPRQILTNDDLSQMVDTSDEWIRPRTGIKTRHLASIDNSLAQLGAKAASDALLMAGLKASDIDLIVLATSTADDLFGSACQIQSLLGASRAVAFDLTAACSGFVFGLITVAQFIRMGVYRNVLLIGGDILSRWVDWSDRNTCILFGDGAGAVVCQGSDEGDRLFGFEMCSDGTLNSYLNLPYQGQSKPLVNELSVAQGGYQLISMNGREVYRFAVAKVPEVIEKALFRAEMVIEDLDWLILHQANQRIMDAVASRLNIPNEKVISNVAHYGNTSAASIPIALDESVRKGKIKPGDRVAISGFGAGLTWGAAIFQWGK
ncbi:3-oxoacyl-(acyl-carrier-protein) synthase III [Gloeothece citriformis PCC 7424]|uniref:Beta-ketoacyl-[acyl-carrier-protein] synthase III n=1 Tax=Gloeothece citriformis (strain PCC 7424) TaxID=65393 RepID=B7KJP8_GLOC7|nr:beta-ketoacyl-ACP synthase III [Gloeothece citriformis]ACK69497.1 3-oxoacyl-(acyl-carrier-protein) synthase III [Gloeothece citriformis PCC 7424]